MVVGSEGSSRPMHVAVALNEGDSTGREGTAVREGAGGKEGAGGG